MLRQPWCCALVSRLGKGRGRKRGSCILYRCGLCCCAWTHSCTTISFLAQKKKIHTLHLHFLPPYRWLNQARVADYAGLHEPLPLDVPHFEHVMKHRRDAGQVQALRLSLSTRRKALPCRTNRVQIFDQVGDLTLFLIQPRRMRRPDPRCHGDNLGHGLDEIRGRRRGHVCEVAWLRASRLCGCAQVYMYPERETIISCVLIRLCESFF